MGITIADFKGEIFCLWAKFSFQMSMMFLSVKLWHSISVGEGKSCLGGMGREREGDYYYYWDFPCISVKIVLRWTYSQKVFILFPIEKDYYFIIKNIYSFFLNHLWTILLFVFVCVYVCDSLSRVQAKGKQILLQAGCPNLSVYGLLLLQSISHSSKVQEDNVGPKEHHLRSLMLCGQSIYQGENLKGPQELSNCPTTETQSISMGFNVRGV